MGTGCTGNAFDLINFEYTKVRKPAMKAKQRTAKCDLDRTYISGIERGKRNVALRNIEAIATGLNLPISEVMKGL